MKNRSAAVLCALLSTCAGLGTSALAQFYNGGTVATPIDSNYVSNSAGEFLYYPNDQSMSHTGFSNPWKAFSVTTPSGSRNRIPMADPTILRIGDTYYVTGTSEAAEGTNLCIYRSTDLVEWFPHMLAFRETYSDGSTTQYFTKLLLGSFPLSQTDRTALASKRLSINGSQYRDIAAPQLYMDPANKQKVWLTFQARKGPDSLPCNTSTSSLPPRTTYLASIDLLDFINGAAATDTTKNAFAVSNTAEPLRYGYKVNNLASGSMRYDGGNAQTVANGYRVIPCSGEAPSASQCSGGNGAPRWYKSPGDSCSFLGFGESSWMSINPFVYFDPKDNNSQWMLYTWFGAGANYAGNHVTAFRMVGPNQMDATGQQIAMAYRFHQWFYPGQETCDSSLPPGGGCYSPNNSGPCAASLEFPCLVMPNCNFANGVVGRFGRRISIEQTLGNSAMSPSCLGSGSSVSNFGIAEGPAVFSRTAADGNRYTYVLYSRNWYAGPAYGIFYRKSLAKLSLSGASSSTDYTTPESELLAAKPANRTIPGGPSFGHGEVFAGPSTGTETKFYVIFHAKEQEDASTLNTPGQINSPASYPSGYSGRSVFFKELTFDTAGNITDIITNTNIGGPQDLLSFRIPRTIHRPQLNP
jgi:hypothetical protein